MTVEEKKEKVVNYCVHAHCEECVLNNKEWLHDQSGCLSISEATEAEVDRALWLINGAPELDVLEQLLEDADTVIKIKSNRKINRLIIEFSEEVQA